MLVSPLRRLWQHPVKTLQPFVGPGMVVLEPGCGMGYFTLDLARMTDPDGRVVAVDLQPEMLDGLRRRARRAGLLDRIDVRLAEPTRLGLKDLVGRVDVALALHVVHELANAANSSPRFANSFGQTEVSWSLSREGTSPRPTSRQPSPWPGGQASTLCGGPSSDATALPGWAVQRRRQCTSSRASPAEESPVKSRKRVRYPPDGLQTERIT